MHSNLRIAAEPPVKEQLLQLTHTVLWVTGWICIIIPEQMSHQLVLLVGWVCHVHHSAQWIPFLASPGPGVAKGPAQKLPGRTL